MERTCVIYIFALTTLLARGSKPRPNNTMYLLKHNHLTADVGEATQRQTSGHGHWCAIAGHEARLDIIWYAGEGPIFHPQ